MDLSTVAEGRLAHILGDEDSGPDLLECQGVDDCDEEIEGFLQGLNVTKPRPVLDSSFAWLTLSSEIRPDKMFQGVVYAWKDHEVPTGASRTDINLAPGKPYLVKDCPFSLRLVFTSSPFDFLSALSDIGITYSIQVFCVMACLLCGFDVTLPYPSRGHNSRIISPFPLSRKYNRFIAPSSSSCVTATDFIHQPVYIDLLKLSSALEPWEEHRLVERSGSFYFVSHPYVCSDCLAYKAFKADYDTILCREYELISL